MVLSLVSKELDVCHVGWIAVEVFLWSVLMLLSWYLCYYYRVILAALKLPSQSMTRGLYYILTNRHVEHSTVEINKMKAMVAKGTKTYVLWTGIYPVFSISDPEDIQTVLLSQKTNEKSFEYKFLKPFFGGHGLFLGKAEPHKHVRRYLNPIFQRKNLNLLMGIYNKSGRLLVNSFHDLIGKGHVDVRPICNKISCRNVTGVMFGPDIDIDINSKEFLDLAGFMEGIANAYIARFYSIWLWPDAAFEFLWKKRLNEYNQLWRSFASVPLKKLKEKESSQTKENNRYHQIDGEGEEEWTSLTFPAAYNGLRRDHPEFTEDDLHHEMITLLVAGTETTGITLSSLLLSLAAKQDVQEKVYQEIVSILGMEERPVTEEDFIQMQYLDQVFKETQRKYSVAPVVMRTVMEDIKLKECTIPAHASIACSFLNLHFDPSIYPDPEEFDPDRFSAENVAKTKKTAFRPFSGGPRDCIGAAYAGYLVKVMVIHVLRRFRLSTTMDITKMNFAIEVTKFSVKGYPIKFHERD